MRAANKALDHWNKYCPEFPDVALVTDQGTLGFWGLEAVKVFGTHD